MWNGQTINAMGPANAVMVPAKMLVAMMMVNVVLWKQNPILWHNFPQARGAFNDLEDQAKINQWWPYSQNAYSFQDWLPKLPKKTKRRTVAIFGIAEIGQDGYQSGSQTTKHKSNDKQTWCPLTLNVKAKTIIIPKTPKCQKQRPSSIHAINTCVKTPPKPQPLKLENATPKLAPLLNPKQRARPADFLKRVCINKLATL